MFFFGGNLHVHFLLSSMHLLKSFMQVTNLTMCLIGLCWSILKLVQVPDLGCVWIFTSLLCLLCSLNLVAYWLVYRIPLVMLLLDRLVKDQVEHQVHSVHPILIANFTELECPNWVPYLACKRAEPWISYILQMLSELELPLYLWIHSVAHCQFMVYGFKCWFFIFTFSFSSQFFCWSEWKIWTSIHLLSLLISSTW